MTETILRPHHSPGDRLRVAILSLACLVAAVPSCATDSAKGESESTELFAPSKLSSSDATRVADVLVRNFSLGGAEFEMTIPFGVATYEMAGTVDWRTHTVEASVASKVNQEPVETFRLWFDPANLYEEVPGLAEALVASGRQAQDWVVRPADPTSSPLDLLLTLLSNLSAENRDNPIALQAGDASSLGSGTLQTPGNRSVLVDRFKLGDIVYAIGVDDDLLYGVEATTQATRSTTKIVLHDHGSKTIDEPPMQDAVTLSSVSDIYESLRPGLSSASTTQPR